MLLRRNNRRNVAPLIALVLGATVCAVSVQAKSRKPYAKDAISAMLKGKVTRNRVAVLARQRGIDFQVTPEVESELRRAGATGSLLATLREVAPKPLAPQAEMPREAVSAPAAGTVRENPKDGLKYVRIPPGTFMMGCSPGDSECDDNEKPPHPVSITKGFWLGQTEVTVSAYKRFAAATGRQMPPEPNIGGRALNPGWGDEAMPIVNVTWDDAQAYCGWAGGRLRLPTEAEWEYAARAGSTAARYGNLDEIAWYADNSGSQRLDSIKIWNEGPANYKKRLTANGNGLHEVGQKRANGFGLFDMLGNVLEWVDDWYGENYYQNSPAQDPPGATSGNARVLRGGSWFYNPGVVRVSYRYGYYPGLRFNSSGFRCGGEVDGP
jgi:formylglycine-generating enzyme required for sulfatase activity